MKTILYENQRGFLFKNGRYIKMLMPGKYHTFGSSTIEIQNLETRILSSFCPIDTLLADKAIAAETVSVEVPDQMLALHFVNGKFSGVLSPGKYLFWKTLYQHEFTLTDTSSPDAANSIPSYLFATIPAVYYTKAEVAEYQKGRLYFNRKLVRILEPGTYYFWKNETKVEVELVDTRLTQLEITGQEILSRDKVTLRINFVCHYRITDFVKITTEIDNFTEQLHVAAQLALRDYVGNYRIDEILENKEQLSQYVLGRLQEKEKDLYLKIVDAGVKDIILPGEIRDIMNTVLVAEKKAQANVIARREEVASTRSLLNTAKLMEENQTLYKLKELEYIERICENVGNINLNGNTDLLTQLAALMKADTGK